MRAIISSAVLTLASLTTGAQFSSPQPIAVTEFAYMTVAVIVDLNGDGANDVVAGGQGSFDDLGCFINDGMGGFGPVQWIDTVTYVDHAVQPVAGDVDGDGDNDLIVIENYTRAFYYENLGMAQFGPPVLVIPTLGDIRGQQLLDVDGDADLDLVLIDYWEDAVDWYANMGGGAFGPKQTVSNSINLITDMHWADIDGDSDPDVVTVTYGGDAGWFANSGTGTFGPIVPIPSMATNESDVITADLDGDGDQDLLGGSGMDSIATWYANNGAGVFGPPQVIAALGEEWYTNSVADVDGDGDLDVLPSGYGHSPFWSENDGTGIFVTQHPVSDTYIGEVRLVDMDTDGDPDAVTVYGAISWQSNDGFGNMGHRRMIYATLQNIETVRLVDIDGDNDLDVAANWQNSSSFLVFYRNDGSGQFGAQEVMVDTLVSTHSFEFADLDGDSDQDVVVQGYFTLGCFINDGTGIFSPGAMFNSAGQGVYGIEVHDFDGDGDMDIVSVDYYAEALELWLNDGSGSFLPSQVAAVLSPPLGIGSADIDGDGDYDLVSSDDGTGALNWYQNDGSAAFSPINIATLPDAIHADDIQLADLNGDGTVDLLYAETGDVIFYANSGGGTFLPAVTVTAMPDPWSTLHAADMDDDGDVDLIIGNLDLEQFYWKANDGFGVFGPDEMLDPTLVGSPKCIRTGDIDGDGRTDVVLARGSGNDTYGIDWYESFVSSVFHIQGTAYHDQDQDGFQDPSEGGLPFVHATATPTASMPLTTANGDFDISADEGTYDVHITMPGLWTLTTTPASYQVTVDSVTPVSTDNDFGYAPAVDTTILALAFVGNTSPCLDTTVQFLSVMNLGTTQPSGTICVTLDTAFAYVSSTPAPTTIAGNTYCWEYDSLYYYSQTLIELLVVNPDPAFIGGTVTSDISVSEEDPLGNVLQTFHGSWTTIVACAYDPNDKQVDPLGYGAAGAVDISTDHLEYTIRFQNTGSAPALDVLLRDQLSADLDWTSLQVLGYSHPVTSVVVEQDGSLVVRFDNIQLPDSGANFAESQGFFRFGIDVLPGLPHGTAIANTASIFFDLNPAVVTNTVTTTLIDCGMWEPEINASGWQALVAQQGAAYQWFNNGIPIIGATDQILFFIGNGSYTAEVTSEFGCVALSDPYVITTAGLEELDVLGIAVVPNPIVDRAQLVFNQFLTSGHSVDVVDIQGHVVRRPVVVGSDRVTLDRTGLAAGIYSVRVLKEGRSLTSVRFVVQ